MILHGALRVQRRGLEEHRGLNPRSSAHANVASTVSTLDLRVGGLDAAAELVRLFEGRFLLLALPRGCRRLDVAPAQRVIPVRGAGLIIVSAMRGIMPVEPEVFGPI